MSRDAKTDPATERFSLASMTRGWLPGIPTGRTSSRPTIPTKARWLREPYSMAIPS